jgi:predicted ArsR family transcriptional regulator
LNQGKANIIKRFIEFGQSKFGNRWGWKKKYADVLGMLPQQLENIINREIVGPSIRERLRELGCDIEWLMTGKKLGERIQLPTNPEKDAMQNYLKSMGIDTLEKLEKVCNPEDLAKDLAFMVRERMAKYKVKVRKK